MFVKKCGAKARTNNYKPCRQPAMANGRCRLHGGLCTGPKTDEGRLRVKEANIKHGFYTTEAIAERHMVRKLIKELEGKV